MDKEETEKMKYCYGCGIAYTGNQCPNCWNTNYTEKPNNMTKKRQCVAMDEGSETGSKSVAVVCNPGSIHAFLIVNTDAWDKVMKSFKDFGKSMDAGLTAVRPLMEDAARKQSEALQQFKREYLGEWIQPSDQVFTFESLRAWREEMLEKQHIARLKDEEERARRRAMLDDSIIRDTFKEVFGTAAHAYFLSSAPVRPLQEIIDEMSAEGLFPELQEKIDVARKEQVQLHKKKGKKVKNWEHTKFWPGRK